MAVKKQLDYDAFGMIERRAANTKDWQKLNLGSNDEFPVFVVGQWRKNRAQNYRLDGCNYYGKGVTYSDEFIMNMNSIAFTLQCNASVYVLCCRHVRPFLLFSYSSLWSSSLSSSLFS